MKTYLPKLPVIILAFGAIIRIIGTGAAALWYDESIVLYRATIPFVTLLTNQTDSSGDLLLDLIERPLMAVSHSLWLLRLPSMLAGLVALWLIWKIMRKLEFNTTQQIFTSAFVAVLPGLLWIAQDARSYSLAAAFGLGGLWFAITGGWLGLVACLGLMGYCHNTAVLYAGGILTVYLLLHREWKRTFIIGAMCVLVWIPQVWHYAEGIFASGPLQPWKPILDAGWFIKSTMQALWTHQFDNLFALLGILFILPLLFSRITNKARVVTLIAWMLPVTIMAFISIVWKNILLYRTLMPMLFPFGMWLGWEFGHHNLPPEETTTRDRLVWGLRGYWLILLLVGLLTFSPSARGAGLDQAAKTIRANWHEGDCMVYGSMTVARPFDYYLDAKPHAVLPIVSNGFLMEPGIYYPNTCNLPDALRIWLVISDDPITAADEREQIDNAYPHGAPLMRLIYLQAAPINIYLVSVNNAKY